MLKFEEHARNGLENGPIVNKSEIHLLVVILLDTSESMKDYMVQLKEGISLLPTSLNDLARGRVEFCIIAFDDRARIITPFRSMYDFKVPEFDCDGLTAMHQAVGLGLNELDARREQLRANKTPHYQRSLMCMLTDGRPTDVDNGEFDQLIKSQAENHCAFYPVAIGDNVDLKLLQTLNQDSRVLRADKENFKEAFAWISNSANIVSNSSTNQTVTLPDPKDYQLQLVVK